jgi:hypothetical protein
MLNKLSEQIRKCLEHAEHCARSAAAQPDCSSLKKDFLRRELAVLGAEYAVKRATNGLHK